MFIYKTMTHLDRMTSVKLSVIIKTTTAVHDTFAMMRTKENRCTHTNQKNSPPQACSSSLLVLVPFPSLHTHHMFSPLSHCTYQGLEGQNWRGGGERERFPQPKWLEEASLLLQGSFKKAEDVLGYFLDPICQICHYSSLPVETLGKRWTE